MSIDKLAYWVCVLSIIGSALYFPRWNQRGPEATISWDTAGYYYYLPAFFIYKDAKKLEFKDKVTEEYKYSGSFYQAYLHEESGNYVMKYSIGQAVMYSPFFLLGHAYASLSDKYPADGFSKPYQRAVHWGSLFIAFLGLWYCRKNLLEYFGKIETGFALLFITIGSNYLNYVAFDGAMTHNWLFTVYALLIWQIIRWHESPSYGRAAAIGLLIGLAALTRPPEIIAVFLALFWGMHLDAAGLKERFTKLGRYAKQLGLSALILLAVGSIQILYWYYITGEPIVYSYQDQGFDWFKPHFKNVIIGYRTGWLMYSPLMVFAVLGLINLYFEKRKLFFGVFLFSLINLYIVSSWSVWWYGGSFGMRALIQSYPVWMFPLTAFLTWMFRYKLLYRVFLPIMFLFCAVNIFFTRGPVDAEYMNEAYYWRCLFNFDLQPEDKFLLDTNEGFFGTPLNLRKNFEVSILEVVQDPDLLYRTKKGVYAIFTDGQNRQSAKITVPRSDIKGKHWIRLTARVKMPQMDYFFWTMPQFDVKFMDGDKVIKERFIRCPRALEQDTWKKVWIDTKIPVEQFDRIELYLSQPHGEKLLVADYFSVEVFEDSIHQK